ncbi:MAG: NAD(+) synthase [Candidatus Omnitrophica bacterium]|nr:NAD(+) synthase [Candidatus Omnitrophota bacterium]
MENEIKNIQNWIKEQVEQAKKDGVILGISGGIDSAIIAFLATQALGKEKVIGVLLPCESSEDSLIDAQNVVSALGIKAYKVDLTKRYQPFKNLFGADETKAFVNANIKSRLRMTVLAAFANQNNMLVIGTTNKTELLTGYYTKFGDGGVDIEPIADFYKTEIYQIAEVLGLPESIINKAPSADLGITSTDEEEFSKIIGEEITYEEIDKIFKHVIEGEEIDISNISQVKVKGVLSLMYNSEHKRNTPPIYERQ